VNRTQYVAVMAGWGGPTTLANRPIGKGKIGPGRLVVFFDRGNRNSQTRRTNRSACSHATFKLSVSNREIDEGSNLFARSARAATGAT